MTSVLDFLMAGVVRDQRGRFAKNDENEEFTAAKRPKDIVTDHNYGVGVMCDGDGCVKTECGAFLHLEIGKHVNRDGWRHGRRIVEFDTLLSSLKTCKKCKLGPVPLTIYSVVGEMKKGLSGYLYVQCQNIECGYINCVPYGKTHHMKQKGMPCFAVNTKLGTAMIDSIGGPVRVNNFLSTLNIQPIVNSNLKKMERRAGDVVEKVAQQSAAAAAKDAFRKEMEDVVQVETDEAAKSMEGVIDDLGVAAFPDSSPSLRQILQHHSCVDDDTAWTDIDDDEVVDDNNNQKSTNSSADSNIDARMPATKLAFKSKKDQRGYHKYSVNRTAVKSGKKLSAEFPCQSRTGMSCAVDTAWHKRGFDSLTSHTFFMSKAKYGKKVVKSIVSHRTCGTCKWWKRNRPGQLVRTHRCVHSHTGSARLIESTSGEQGVKELMKEGTPIEYLEGDGDTALIARLRNNLNINMKKRFDRNHIVKNIGKNLYALQASKGTKLSRNVILHIQKRLNYAFAKNAGNKVGLRENLKALIPHQFGDHTSCHERFCGYKRKPRETYTHRSLPYKGPLKDTNLRSQLEKVFEPVIANAEQYADLGSSQQCEHANREVTLRAPKSLHYGNSESLDYRVQATAAFINEVHSEVGLSPGVHTQKYAQKCTEHRKRVQSKSQLPSSKRRRLILKQERAITQGAHEALEGATYQSGVGHEDIVDVEKLPDPVPRGEFKPVTLVTGEPTFITFDLETTDLIRGGQFPHITQIAAAELNSGRSFNAYVIPKTPITSTAQQVTGIVMSGSNSMSVNGMPVEAEFITPSLEKFCKWLEQFDNVILLAHNGRRFDYPVLMKAVASCKLLERFLKCVSGFVDSLTVLRKHFPGRSSYKQEDLVREILRESYGAHNATEDVKALGSLLKHISVSPKTMLSFSYPPKSVRHPQLFNLEKAKNMPSLHVLVANGVCKTATAENIAGSGLNLSHLKIIFKREGEDGLRNTFVVKNSEGQPRVTNTKRTLETVIPNLVEYLKK